MSKLRFSLAAASGSDVMILLPTGFGKTISFWALPFFIDFVFNDDPRDEDGAQTHHRQSAAR
jgi:hypothetical protein